MSNQEYKQLLLALMQDTESFEKLSKWSYSINIFDVLKISRTEIRHSNMLGWLLNPNENHGMGDFFLYSVFVKLSSSIELDLSLKLLSSDLYTYTVKREWKNIDILLVSDKHKIVVSIENKIGSHEHNQGQTEESQLKVYEKVINQTYADYDKIFVYLTPDGEIPTESCWIILTYSDLLDLLQEMYEAKKTNLNAVSNLLIDNYIANLKKNVIMDQELINLCNDIYKKHKTALDLIYENRDDDALRISKLCREILAKQKSSKYVIPDENTKSNIKFNTNSMEEYFSSDNELKSLENYYYQFQIRIKDDYLILELVFHKEKSTELKEEIKKKLNALVPGKRKIQSNAWEWKRAWSHKINNISGKTDEEISANIEECLKKMLENENKIIKSSNEK